MSTDTRRRNDGLCRLIAQGSKAARDELVELNMPLVVLKVDGYLACFAHLEYLRDDLIAEGNLALVQAVTRMQEGEVKDATSYMSTSIQKAIGHFIDGELYTPSGSRGARTARRRHGDGDDAQTFHKVPNSEFVLDKLYYDPSQEAELLDLIRAQCESDEERAIVDLRIKGYVDSEIAKALDIPLTTTFMLRRELYQRVLATGEVTSDS